MKKNSIYNRLTAAVLLALVLLSNTGRLLHLLYEHRHDADQRVCSIDDNDGKKHLHDAHFLTEGCQLCHFVVQSSVLPELPYFDIDLQPAVVQPGIFAPECPFLAIELTANLLRGPPAGYPV